MYNSKWVESGTNYHEQCQIAQSNSNIEHVTTQMEGGASL